MQNIIAGWSMYMYLCQRVNQNRMLSLKKKDFRKKIRNFLQ